MKKFFLVSSCLIMSLGFSVASSPKAEAVSSIDQRINGNEATYTYWMQDTSSLSKTSYGSWVDRTQYTVGPAEKTYTHDTTTSWSVEASAELSYNEIKSGLNSTFTSSKTISNELKVTIPKGKKAAYQTRDKFNHYKVKMIEWISIDGRKSKTGKTKTVTIKKKVGFEDRANMIKA